MNRWRWVLRWAVVCMRFRWRRILGGGRGGEGRDWGGTGEKRGRWGKGCRGFVCRGGKGLKVGRWGGGEAYICVLSGGGRRTGKWVYKGRELFEVA